MANLIYFPIVSEELIQEMLRSAWGFDGFNPNSKALILRLLRENAEDLSNSAIPDSSRAESGVLL
jgi:hypothetical protein